MMCNYGDFWEAQDVTLLLCQLRLITRTGGYLSALIASGFRNDVEFACQKDIFSITPIVKDNKIMKFQK